MSKKLFTLLSALLLVTLLLGACGPQPRDDGSAGRNPKRLRQQKRRKPQKNLPAQGEPFTIGISNPFISSEYRTQMIDELIEVNQEYMDQGITTELVIESADTDVAGQIQQLQNLIAQDVDAILVNPGDVSGLNATLQEAVDKGIIVISVDQELNVPGVYNVGIDQKAWAMTSARWLADKMGGEGDIVLIEGFPGHPGQRSSHGRRFGSIGRLPRHQRARDRHRQLGRSHRPAGDVQLPGGLPQPGRLLDPGRHGHRRVAGCHGCQPGRMAAGCRRRSLPVPEAVGRSPDDEPGLRQHRSCQPPRRFPDRPAHCSQHAAGQTGR
jgi:hypothetical protein